MKWKNNNNNNKKTDQQKFKHFTVTWLSIFIYFSNCINIQLRELLDPLIRVYSTILGSQRSWTV